MVTAINYNNGKQVSYQYNAIGDLVEMTDWTGTTSFEVDLLSRITKTTDIKGKVVEYTYDATGNQTSVAYPDGTTATKTYDLLGQLKTVTEDDGRTTSYTYDGMGRLSHMEYPHGWVEDYTYDSIGQLIKVEDTDPTEKDMKQQKHAYAYDDCGNMTYEYMRGNGIGESSAYLYNGLGALVENTWVIKKNAYGYHDVSAQTVVEGEVVVDSSTGKKDKKEKKTADEVAASAELNKTSTVVKQFVVDYTSETFEPLMEHEVNGFDYHYVYGNDRLSVDIKGVTTSSGNIIENGDHIRLYYHMDYLGTADYLTSPVSGKITSWTHYNEWGEITHNAVLKCGQRELDMVKRYATHDYDSVLGMYYAKARFYDAELRRFVATDPILNAERYDIKNYTANPTQLVQYLYVGNNPVVFIDPDGKIAFNQFDDFAKGMVDYAGDILKTIKLFSDAVLHPIETAKSIINTIKSLVSALSSGELSAAGIAKALGTTAVEAFVGDIFYIAKHFEEFGRRTVGAVVQAISLVNFAKMIQQGLSTKSAQKLADLLPENSMSQATTQQMLAANTKYLQAVSSNQSRLSKILTSLRGNPKINTSNLRGTFGKIFVDKWQTDEQWVRSAIGAAGGKTFQVAGQARRVDAFNKTTGVIAEVKTGSISLSSFVKTEIARDVALLGDASTGVKSIQWHFFSKAGELGIGGPPY